MFPTYRRIEMRCVSYREGDKLIRESVGKSESEKWHIAKEEDGNRVINKVYLERKERIKE
jgi:hypothetical protein